MSHHKIEFDRKCKSCGGTGLYVGMAERDGAAIVCHKCKGTGCEHIKIEYYDFEGRVKKEGVERVFQANPGIAIGKGKGKYTLSCFGGLPIKEWENGREFSHGMEMRAWICPAWYYQTADYSKKPSWGECNGAGSFSGCSKFKAKGDCWTKWDKENGKTQKQKGLKKSVPKAEPDQEKMRK